MTATALLGLLLLLVIATGLWLQSLRLADASIADIGWGPGFAVLAWLYPIQLAAPSARAWFVAGLVTVWATRLAWHIWRRGHGRGEDPRYTAMRRGHGDAFRWRSLVIVFGLQASLLWIVAWPLLPIAAADLPFGSATDWLGVAVALAGLALEATADRQLARFRRDPRNAGRLLTTGVWAWSRHPNYFGDAVFWWGLFVVAVGVPFGWTTVLGPVLMTTLLVRVSGVALLERTMSTRPGWAEYAAATPAFVPRPWRHRGTPHV